MSVPPSLYALTGGKLSARCGRCLATSGGVSGESPEAAWETLLALGWTHYISPLTQGGVSGYAICPKCARDPHDMSVVVARAMRSRKHK